MTSNKVYIMGTENKITTELNMAPGGAAEVTIAIEGGEHPCHTEYAIQRRTTTYITWSWTRQESILISTALGTLNDIIPKGSKEKKLYYAPPRIYRPRMVS